MKKRQSFLYHHRWCRDSNPSSSFSLELPSIVLIMGSAALCWIDLSLPWKELLSIWSYKLSPQGQKKKVVLFPEIGRVKIFLSLTSPHSRMCIKIYSKYILIFQKKPTKQNKTKEDKKQKNPKKKRECLWKIKRNIMVRLRICPVYFLTYLMDSWISPGCSYKFLNVEYVQREKSQYFLYYNNIRSTHKRYF